MIAYREAKRVINNASWISVSFLQLIYILSAAGDGAFKLLDFSLHQEQLSKDHEPHPLFTLPKDLQELYTSYPGFFLIAS